MAKKTQEKRVKMFGMFRIGMFRKKCLHKNYEKNNRKNNNKLFVSNEKSIRKGKKASYFYIEFENGK